MSDWRKKMEVASWVGIISGISAIIVVISFAWRRGKREGELCASQRDIKEEISNLQRVIPEVVGVQTQLASVCTSIASQASELLRGTLKFDELSRELVSIRERLTRVETIINNRNK